MYRVDITADLNDEDETGYVWTFLDEARDPRHRSVSARTAPPRDARELAALRQSGDRDLAFVSSGG
jgi:hypothetical protein